MKNNWILLLCFGWLAGSLQAQTNLLRPEAFLLQVLEGHPLAKQAKLIPEFAETYVLKARGGFDPKLSYDLSQKYYGNKMYFSLSDANLKVPTWYGLSLQTGLEQNRGSYLDPQGSTPQNGLWYGGLSANLGNGLVIDERRAELQKANVYLKSSQLEQRLALNELIMEAGYAYWDWYLQYHAGEILKDALSVGAIRLKAMQRMAELGDRPFIDTVEAAIQYQTRAAALADQEAKLAAANAQLNRYLWRADGTPLELAPETLPLTNDSLAARPARVLYMGQVDSMVQQHPYLGVINFKLDVLAIEKRYNKEQLKPQIELKYNFLNEPIQYNPLAQFSINDYKWGVSAQMPLFLRKERAVVQQTQLKIEQTNFDFQNRTAELTAKLLATRAEYINASKQLSIFMQNAQSTKKLLEAELNLFETGESSLFMVNMRESAAFQAALKVIEYQAKCEQLWLKWEFLQANLVR
ncbi:MAG: TolC family protein [Flavobacteriales bacterium]